MNQDLPPQHRPIEKREGPFFSIESFSKGKTPEKNEDAFGYTKDCIVIADGATDKSGNKYGGKTGGEIVSKLVVEEALSSELTGAELVNFLNEKVSELYKKFNITDKITDPKYRFTCGCIAVKITENKLVITYTGDLGFRINGNEVYQEKKQIDIDNAEARAKYIEETKDIAGSREHIKPGLLKQFEYQNNPNHPLGYGVIDGTNTPEKFIKTFEYPKDQINMIELFSDGYFDTPQGTTIEDWENIYKKVEEEDPDKCRGKTKSTKSSDDRTVVIIKFAPSSAK